MKFIAVGNYTKEGLAGFMKNPDDDRRAVIAAMVEKAGGKLHEFYVTRGTHDVVAVGEAPDYETAAALKFLILAGGAFENLELLEMVDFKAICNKAAQLADAYTPPGQ